MVNQYFATHAEDEGAVAFLSVTCVGGGVYNGGGGDLQIVEFTSLSVYPIHISNKGFYLRVSRTLQSLCFCCTGQPVPRLGTRWIL